MRINVVGIAAVLATAALLLSLTGRGTLAQETANQNPTPPAFGLGGENSFDPNQPIKPGFTLTIQTSTAAGVEPDLSGTFVVDPSGNITMKLVGPIQVKGLTPLQATDKIAVALKPYLKDAKVTVAITAVPKPIIIVSGAVSRPGSAPINDQTTLAEVLTVLGYTENADLSRVRVIHKDENGNRTVKEYNFLRWLKPAPGEPPDETQNPVLNDRDFVFVPPRVVTGPGSIRVEGAVLRPGIVPIPLGVPTTLREAISLAGGPTPVADRREIWVRRLNLERPILVDYDKMEANDPIHNITMQTEDVVYVQTLDVDKFVNLNGAFVRPGKLPYTKPITLTQAVAEASGMAPTAKEKDGRIFRHIGGADPTKTQIIAFNYIDIRKNKQPDILLEPGDTVEIPIGFGPRPPLTPLELTQSLLSIALIVDRLFSRSNGVGF